MSELSNDDRKCIDLQELIQDIGLSNILEIWCVTYGIRESKSSNYVAILNDGSHMCTCLWIVSRGLICRHFFRVLRTSNKAVFGISLIASRWHKEVTDSINIEHEKYNISAFKYY